jgi:PAS domain S-box-containing protein
MSHPFSLFVVFFLMLYLLSGTIALVFALISWRHRDITISVPFTVLMAALAIWFYGYVLELLSSDLASSQFFNNIEVPCTVIVPAAFLLIVLYYTGHEKYVTKKTLVIFILGTAIVSALEFSNPFHHLYYLSFYPETYDGSTVWMHVYGPFFWLGLVYTYSLTILALVLIISHIVGTGTHQRRPLYLLLLASVIPIIINILGIFRLMPFRGIDLTPIAFLITGLILAFGLFRYLFFTMPVAYKRIITSMLDGVIITNGPSRIIDLNPAAELITGIRAQDAIGKEITDILPQLAPCVTGTEGYGTVSRAECVFPQRDGQSRYFDVVIMPMGSRVTAAVGLFILRDITELKRAELALAEANRKISLLSGITRHDIRNQLTALSAYLMLSEETRDDPKLQADYLAIEQKIAERIEHQISFTKYYEEMGINAPVWQNVPASIRAAVDELTTDASCVRLDMDTVEVYADSLMGKVFYNLIDNALRYGGPGLTIIHITSRIDGTDLELVFKDNGMGIAEGDKVKLFTKGFGKNTGLGLFLSREILSLTGITITEDGEPGTGARFRIRVPAGCWRPAGSR